MGKPAARLMDMTMHGGMVTGPGAPTVLIGKMPAAKMTDMHVCPMCNGPVPHVGGPHIGPVPPTVFVSKMPAACMGDMHICTGPPATILPPACPTVLFGPAGACGGGPSGGGGGGGGGGASALSGKAPSSVKGLETAPIEIQKAMAEAAQYMTPEQIELQVKVIMDSLGTEGSGGQGDDEDTVQLTIADIVEILEQIESEEGYEAARFFASHLDYGVITEMAMGFVTGDNPDGNDPNQMPTRFMLLYGMDDAKLQCEDDHPDRFEGEEHKINIANLRKGLRLLGYEVAENGPYDDELMKAHWRFLAANTQTSDAAALAELEEYDEGEQSAAMGELILQLDVDPDDPSAQDDVFTLFSTGNNRKYEQMKTVKDDTDGTNNTLELKFTDLNTTFNYTLEIDPGASGKKEYLFSNKPYGKWF
jgi:uncharacterized Zn-binding protein involved in type VI secretion